MSFETVFDYSSILKARGGGEREREGGSGVKQEREMRRRKNSLEKSYRGVGGGEGEEGEKEPNHECSRLRPLLPGACVALLKDKPWPVQPLAITDPSYQRTVGDLSAKTGHSRSEAAQSAG